MLGVVRISLNESGPHCCDDDSAYDGLLAADAALAFIRLLLDTDRSVGLSEDGPMGAPMRLKE